MMCPNCKQLIDDDKSFCPYCGTKLAFNNVNVPPANYDPTYESRRVALIISIIACALLAFGGGSVISLVLGIIALKKSNNGMEQTNTGSREWKQWKTVHTLAMVATVIGVIAAVIATIGLLWILSNMRMMY